MSTWSWRTCLTITETGRCEVETASGILPASEVLPETQRPNDRKTGLRVGVTGAVAGTGGEMRGAGNQGGRAEVKRENLGDAKVLSL